MSRLLQGYGGAVMSGSIETHPVQVHYAPRPKPSRVSTKVTLLAYEVYREVHGEQVALVTGNCRGGFGLGELIGFLYARSFPKSEWRVRVKEAYDGMVLP